MLFEQVGRSKHLYAANSQAYDHVLQVFVPVAAHAVGLSLLQDYHLELLRGQKSVRATQDLPVGTILGPYRCA